MIICIGINIKFRVTTFIIFYLIVNKQKELIFIQRNNVTIVKNYGYFLSDNSYYGISILNIIIKNYEKLKKINKTNVKPSRNSLAISLKPFHWAIVTPKLSS